MADDDDDLAALRDADPVDHASLPSPTDTAAAALFERIAMTDTDADTDTHTAPPPGRSAPRRAWLAAAAALVVVGGVAVALTRDSGESPAPGRAATPTTETDGAITPGGAASCVELYDLTTLTHREIALDATITEVTGDQLTVAVNRWYRGGESDELTLDGASTLGGITSAGSPVSLAPGTRLLIAGDGGFAWGCGFTQPYDPAVAEAWEDAIGG
jgi:hypothetical protein